MLVRIVAEGEGGSEETPVEEDLDIDRTRRSFTKGANGQSGGESNKGRSGGFTRVRA